LDPSALSTLLFLFSLVPLFCPRHRGATLAWGSSTSLHTSSSFGQGWKFPIFLTTKPIDSFSLPLSLCCFSGLRVGCLSMKYFPSLARETSSSLITFGSTSTLYTSCADLYYSILSRGWRVFLFFRWWTPFYFFLQWSRSGFLFLSFARGKSQSVNAFLSFLDLPASSYCWKGPPGGAGPEVFRVSNGVSQYST